MNCKYEMYPPFLAAKRISTKVCWQFYRMVVDIDDVCFDKDFSKKVMFGKRAINVHFILHRVTDSTATK